MKSKILAGLLAAVLAIPAAMADQAAKPEKAAKSAATTDKVRSESRTVERRATVTAIDSAKRIVSLKGEKGAEFDVEVGPEVQNLDQLKVGDVVKATYTESLAVHIAKPGEAEPGVKESVSGTPVGQGQGRIGHEVTATLKVEAVDAKANTVTLSDGAGHSRTVDVVNPKAQERLKTLKPGENVVITYTESLAIKLDKVTK